MQVNYYPPKIGNHTQQRDTNCTTMTKFSWPIDSFPPKSLPLKPISEQEIAQLL